MTLLNNFLTNILLMKIKNKMTDKIELNECSFKIKKTGEIIENGIECKSLVNDNKDYWIDGRLRGYELSEIINLKYK